MKQDWEKEFDEIFKANSDYLIIRQDIKQHIRSLLARREEVKEKYKGETKRIWYQKGCEETRQEMIKFYKPVLKVTEMLYNKEKIPLGLWEEADRSIKMIVGKGES